MNLAFCLFKYFPFGGLQRDFLRIARECLRRGHNVDVYTMEWEGDRDPLLTVKIISPSGYQNHTRCKNFVTQLHSHLNKEKYDLVVGFNKIPGLDIYYAADTCFQAKARAKHGAWYRLTPRYRHLVEFEQAVFAASMKANILLISKHQQPEFTKYYATQSQRFHLLPPGISKDRIAPSNANEIRTQTRMEFNIKPNDFLLLLIGSGFKTKGLDRALIGIANLPADIKNRTQLFVIGQDHSEIFERQAKNLAIENQIKFLGGRDDVSRLLLAGDLLVHPAYNENTGTVLLEAIVSGLPVLTTDVCGYADYVLEAQSGIVLASPYQQSQFNKAMADMLLSSQRTAWQNNALLFAKTADIYSMPERAVDIIEALGR